MSIRQLHKTANEVYSASKVQPKEGIVILQPVAMSVPNRHHIYGPSKLEPQKAIRYAEFLVRYADHPRKIRICFAETSSVEEMLRQANLVTAYSFGADCWYIVMP